MAAGGGWRWLIARVRSRVDRGGWHLGHRRPGDRRRIGRGRTTDRRRRQDSGPWSEARMGRSQKNPNYRTEWQVVLPSWIAWEVSSAAPAAALFALPSL
ncbi:hypothetical protein BO71DRAFT_404705 [Aspergillus ellipticus CBS 707.79]|uniref:Uncharacterized protein n=1 Tax=Aspergillus ellipticus CBS 707.79 TaxID=1448320 RepID=A0A319E8H6_9EURO|nr:hypothetical protein BO71DRAFT_404705 [Aspergillus ellipticus CBS 707.79]